MNTLLLALTTYGLTIVFAMIVAVVIQGLGVLVKKLNLERDDVPLDLGMPTADSAREEAAIAVAISVAAAARAGRRPVKARN